MSKALLAKMAWRLLTQKEATWASLESEVWSLYGWSGEVQAQAKVVDNLEGTTLVFRAFLQRIVIAGTQ